MKLYQSIHQVCIFKSYGVQVPFVVHQPAGLLNTEDGRWLGLARREV